MTNTRTITVKGTTKVCVRPDQTEITLTLRSSDRIYETAVGHAEEQLSRLREALSAVGFAEDDLKTTDFNVNTEYESIRDENGNYTNVFKGFVCTHGLCLSFPFRSERLAEVLSAVTESVAEPELNVRFTVSDPEAVRETLLRGTAEDAHKKAALLASAAGVRLGALLSVEYGKKDETFSSRTNFGMDGVSMAKARSVQMHFTPEDITADDTAVFVWEID